MKTTESFCILFVCTSLFFSHSIYLFDFCCFVSLLFRINQENHSINCMNLNKNLKYKWKKTQRNETMKFIVKIVICYFITHRQRKQLKYRLSVAFRYRFRLTSLPSSLLLPFIETILASLFFSYMDIFPHLTKLVSTTNKQNKT